MGGKLEQNANGSRSRVKTDGGPADRTTVMVTFWQSTHPFTITSLPSAGTVTDCHLANRSLTGSGGIAPANVSSTVSRASAGAFCGEKSASRAPVPSTGASGIELTVTAPRWRLAPTVNGGKFRQFI